MCFLWVRLLQNCRNGFCHLSRVKEPESTEASKRAVMFQYSHGGQIRNVCSLLVVMRMQMLRQSANSVAVLAHMRLTCGPALALSILGMCWWLGDPQPHQTPPPLPVLFPASRPPSWYPSVSIPPSLSGCCACSPYWMCCVVLGHFHFQWLYSNFYWQNKKIHIPLSAEIPTKL